MWSEMTRKATSGLLVGSAVGLAAECGYAVEQRLEHVGVVVGLFALHGHRQALEAHARVDVLVRQGHERAVGHAVELHEDEVPDFDHLRVVGVDQGGARCGGPVGVAAEVDVDFRARSAGPGFAHFPEVVLLRGEQDAVFGYPFGPNALGLLVRFQAVSGVPFKHGHVQAILVQAVHLGEQFPRPIDGLLLEVIAKRPVAEHLEHGVVVGVHADFFQVVVLATHAQAFLGVGDARMHHRAVAQKEVFERIHPRVVKHQRRIIFDDHGSRWNDFVAFRGEEFEEALANEF